VEERQEIGEMKSFTEEDLSRIREAVQAVERRTRGEIVPMVVPSSGLYRDAGHLAGLLTGLLVLVLALTVDTMWPGWGRWMSEPYHFGLVILGAIVGYVAGHQAGSTPVGIRLFTSKPRMSMKVRHRAERAFHQHGLHKTRDGTGVLIMISLLERQVQVLADRAINEVVPRGTWEHIVQVVVRGIKDDRPVDGLCRAIAECGEILARHFPVSGSNPDELQDDLIQER